MLLSSSPQSNRLIWPSVAVCWGMTSVSLLSSYFSFVSPLPYQVQFQRTRKESQKKTAKRPHKQKLKIQYARLGKAHDQKDARKSCIGFLYKFSPTQIDLAPSCLLQTWESASKTGFCVYACMCVVTVETFWHLEGLSLYVQNLNYRAASSDCNNQSVISASQS